MLIRFVIMILFAGFIGFIGKLIGDINMWAFIPIVLLIGAWWDAACDRGAYFYLVINRQIKGE